MKNSVVNVRDELTYKMKIHGTLCGGFGEMIYQRCLTVKMASRSLAFEQGKEQRVATMEA